MKLGLLSVIAWSLSAAAMAADVACLEIRPEKTSALVDAAREGGLRLVAGPTQPTASLPAVVVWEFREGRPVSDAWAADLEKYVQQGGAILFSLARRPGTGPMRLAALAPTSGWNPQSNGGENRHDRLRLAEADEVFFGIAASKLDLELPYFHEIRPFHAVERGQTRYDRFERPVPWVPYGNPGDKVPTLAADTNWWSRPLLNRDWTIRARGDDVRGSPLLLTGLYGAGRVAVFASSLEEMPGGAGSRRFFSAVLKWLNAARPAAAPGLAVEFPPVKIIADRRRRCLIATLHNPTQTPLAVEVVARVLTWEPALVGDVRQAATLPPEKSLDVEIPLPRLSATSYQAISDRDAFHVRVGVLSGDGRKLLSETPFDVDLRGPLRLKLATQEIRSFKPRFDAPPPGMPNRLGLPVMTYAAAPGQVIEAVATIDNGLQNLATLARIRDEADPQNRTLAALTDGTALAERGPDWYALNAYGCYLGPAGKNVDLSFTFERPVWLAAVSVLAAGDAYRNHDRHNPASVTVEVDGREVARERKAGELLLHNYGLIRIPFEPVQARQVRLRMSRGKSNNPIWLGEISLEGGLTLPPNTAKTTLTVARQAGFGGPSLSLASQEITIGPLQRIEVPVKVPLPESELADFYRLTASLNTSDGTQQADVPILAVSPKHPLVPISRLNSNDIPSLGFIVTRGFRNALDTGTGTAEDLGGWGQPDDLIWAYERGLKQLSDHVRTEAARLYVSENDLRHYCSPWKPFYNGEEFFDIAAPRIVERMKHDRRWARSDQVTLGFSDRWDPGPQLGAMHSWQDFEGFNAWLLERGKPALQGRTRRELSLEIHARYEGLWNTWHLERFLHSLAELREGFAREGKRLVLTAQGIPMIPGAAAEEVGRVEQGVSDDSTWGQAKESVSLTTARQMAALSFTPSLAMSTLLHWGYNSAALNNCQWHGAIGTTEPSRRHLFDRAFRGTLRPDGVYTSMHVYGYGSNAGEGFTLTSEDLDSRQRVQDLHSLLTPDGPIGAGIVLSTAPRSIPSQVRFDCGDALALPEARDLALAASRLHDAGVSIPFSANAACLEKWRGAAPLVLTNLPGFSEAEIATLRTLAARGVRLAAFVQGEKLSAAAAELFGVSADGVPVTGTKVGEVAGRPIVARGPCLFIPLAAGRMTEPEARAVAPLLIERLRVPIRFPAGACGYGFASNSRHFVVVEDWREEARIAPLRIAGRPGWTSLRAVDVNSHRDLKVEKQGGDWVINVPLRPGDGVLVAIEVQQ